MSFFKAIHITIIICVASCGLVHGNICNKLLVTKSGFHNQNYSTQYLQLKNVVRRELKSRFDISRVVVKLSDPDYPDVIFVVVASVEISKARIGKKTRIAELCAEIKDGYISFGSSVKDQYRQIGINTMLKALVLSKYGNKVQVIEDSLVILNKQIFLEEFFKLSGYPQGGRSKMFMVQGIIENLARDKSKLKDIVIESFLATPAARTNTKLGFEDIQKIEIDFGESKGGQLKYFSQKGTLKKDKVTIEVILPNGRIIVL